MTAMSSTADTWRAQRYSAGARRSSLTGAVTTDGEQPAVHEPGDDDGPGHQPEHVAQRSEQEQLHRAHRVGRVGRTEVTGPV